MIWQLEYNFVSITELPKNALTFRIEKSDTWPVATTQKNLTTVHSMIVTQIQLSWNDKNSNSCNSKQ